MNIKDFIKKYDFEIYLLLTIIFSLVIYNMDLKVKEDPILSGLSYALFISFIVNCAIAFLERIDK